MLGKCDTSLKYIAALAHSIYGAVFSIYIQKGKIQQRMSGTELKASVRLISLTYSKSSSSVGENKKVSGCLS